MQTFRISAKHVRNLIITIPIDTRLILTAVRISTLLRQQSLSDLNRFQFYQFICALAIFIARNLRIPLHHQFSQVRKILAPRSLRENFYNQHGFAYLSSSRSIIIKFLPSRFPRNRGNADVTKGSPFYSRSINHASGSR